MGLLERTANTELMYSPRELGASDADLIKSLLGIRPNDPLEETVARKIVSILRFDVLQMYSNLVAQLGPGKSIFDIYQQWQPDVLSDTFENGGSDCFGLAKTMEEVLRGCGFTASLIPFDTQGLPATEASDVTKDIGSVGVLVQNEQDMSIFEPGFALVTPLTVSVLSPQNTVECDGRIFSLDVDCERGTGIFQVQGERHSPKEIGIRLQPVADDVVTNVQHDYLKIRPTIHCDRFDDSGVVIASIKIRLIDEQIVISLGKEKIKIPFSQWSTYETTELAQRFDMNPEELHSQIQKVLRHSGQIRALWTESLWQQYFEKTQKSVLESRYRTWEEASQDGYSGGGVVSFIVNSQRQILLYEVPQSREKPKIGRYVGQLNTMTETSDQKEGGRLEEFTDNLHRGLREELAIDMNETPVVLRNESYRETTYGLPFPDGTKTLARCCVVEWNGDPTNLHFSSEAEGGTWKWYDIDRVLGYELEPNLRPILERYIHEGIL